MNDLRQAAQAAEDFLDRRWRKTGACDDDIREHAEALRAALAEPQPEPLTPEQRAAISPATLRRYDEAQKTAPQAQQPRFVKPWRKRLPRSPMNCSASEVVAAQQAEIDEWRNGRAMQPLTDEQVTELRSRYGWAKETIRAIEAALGIGVKNGTACSSYVSSET